MSFFDKLIDEEWEKPQKSFVVPQHLAVRYPVEDSLLRKWASPLVVDPPVAQLNKVTTLPVEGTLAFKDYAHRRSEAVTRSMFTMLGSALRPILAANLVSQTFTEWAKVLHQTVVEHQVPPEYVRLADQLV